MKENKKIGNDAVLALIEDKIKTLEIKERQKYNYYCDRTNNCWNWTKEQDDKFQDEWNQIIHEIKVLKEALIILKKEM